MSETIEHATVGGTVELRCIQALASDPLFEGASYVFSVEGNGSGFELRIEMSPYYVNLLTMGQRRRLEGLAADAARRLLDEGIDRSTTGRISSDGVLLVGDRVVADLLGSPPA